MKFGLRHIRYFIAVAEEMHFRRAAERLNIAQPALSRAIQQLEHALEVTLFDRAKRNVRLTSAGQAFLKGSRGVVNAVENTIEDARQAHNGQTGLLRIGYTDMAISGVLPSLLKAFQTERPGITLKPHHHVSSAQLPMLEAGELDIGFVTGPVSRAGYEHVTIQSEELFCVVYSSHPLAHRESILLEELAHEDFVHGSKQDWQHFYACLIPLCQRAGFLPNIVQEAYNSAAILGLVSCGMGITILTESAKTALFGDLVALKLDGVTERLETVALWKGDTEDGSKSLFVDFVRSNQIAAER